MNTGNKKLLIAGDPQDAKEYFRQKICFTTGPMDVKRFQETGEDFTFIDVREAEAFAKGHPVGAVNLPRNKWDTYQGLNKEQVNIVFCYSQTCHLAARAALKFAARGYPVMEMEGGFQAWQDAKLAVDSGETARKSA
jgi:rhodanese-related sulfurtransferase